MIHSASKTIDVCTATTTKDFTTFHRVYVFNLTAKINKMYVYVMLLHRTMFTACLYISSTRYFESRCEMLQTLSITLSSIVFYQVLIWWCCW